MNDTCETMWASGPDGPVKVNVSDFEADQEKPKGERQWSKLAESKQPDEPETPPQTIGVDTGTMGNGPALAAPSAPHFGEAQNPDNIDPLKNAVAPAVTPTGLYVMMLGKGNAKKKYFVVDQTGAKVTDKAGIEADGYETEVQAQKAINDLPH